MVANFLSKRSQYLPTSCHISSYSPKPTVSRMHANAFVVTSKQWDEKGNLRLMIIDFQTCSYGLLGKRSPHNSTFSNIIPHLSTPTDGKTHVIGFCLPTSCNISPYSQSRQSVECMLMLLLLLRNRGLRTVIYG